jgi:signal recognition particle receptor subunit beta
LFINRDLREVHFKIVYYGPALSGKTTNLQVIYARTDPDRRSDLVMLKTRKDRTMYFDFLLLELGKVAGLKPRLHLYTVPGQVYYGGSRKLVLQGTDGVVFVADSRVSRKEANVETMENLKVNLRELGQDPETLPLVLQCNKRDLPSIAPMEEIRDSMALVDGRPTLPAVAAAEEGVLETLSEIVDLVVAGAKGRL